ncbi:chemotaxis protein CheA [Oceanicoccus sp. KOV_DT_Chl]|uniref:chemotaxis protein CheA n=1 Tax=Oceanicoccus sp. KOV_DT_Chl TaxID=1904639 RepID=UPI000C7C3E07|nr:chemotaxis protein CheA [Oceanicoccus sp. KOV_DT_Chl]
MSMDAALDTFIAEAQELLEQMEAALLRIGDGDNDPETLNEIFRAAHTIKGSSGLFGLDNIVAFTHKVENVLDRARDGDFNIEKDLLNILLKCGDHIGSHVAAVIAGVEISAENVVVEQELVEALGPWLAEESPSSDDEEDNEENNSSEGCWHLSIRLSGDVLQNGMDPLSILKFLKTMGEFQYFETITNTLPAKEKFDPETLYFNFELGLISSASREAINDAFMFVADGAEIKLVPPQSAIEEYIKLIKSSGLGQRKLGEILVNSGALTLKELDDAVSDQVTQLFESGAKKPLGEMLMDQQQVSPQVVSAALQQQTKERTSTTRFIRVDSECVDQLINLIGELLVSRQRIDLLCDSVANNDLEEAVTGMGSITEQIQDAALNLRMVPIGDTFQRFQRVVRDTAAGLDKDIRLVLEGSETELDRSMVERLVDPLTHIVRNSIDHGVEPVSIRKERNKPEQGLLKLSAYHDAGSIVIEVRDDGGGLDTNRIRQKAIDNGVVEASQQLSNHDIHQLIFHAGLSTADSVTDLSGRGVGMDVVRRNIESLQGGIEIESESGKGTMIRIRLPLTLAIIDGFHVSAYGTDFIIPQATILECMDFNSVEHVAGRNSINLRGELVPYLSLKSIFALAGSKTEPEKLVVVKFGNDRAAIIVDVLHGEIQTVIKPLGPIFQALKGVGGSSLLGGGEIAFILDIPQLIHSAVLMESRHKGVREDFSA